MELNLERAMKTTGWLKPKEAIFLAQEAAKCKKIVELGSYRGRSTRVLLDNSEAHLWCVDTWNTRVTRRTTTTDKDYRAFLRNIADQADRVTVLRMSTDDAVEIVRADAPFDMVWIDAAHTYEWVKHDISAYAPMVAEGGLLCGHDAHYKPVLQAVNALLGECPIEDTIWYVRRDETWPI